MVNRPSVPEVITVNSEDLQAQIRDLLPSQRGFGSELQATNVITPIIDLTRAAEGSNVGENLQTALAFGSQTSVFVENATTTGPNTPGFWRLIGCLTALSATTGQVFAEILLNDGSTTKRAFTLSLQGTGSVIYQSVPFDFVVFLRAGDSVDFRSSAAKNFVQCCYRQIALGDGTLVQPNGFPV